MEFTYSQMNAQRFPFHFIPILQNIRTLDIYTWINMYTLHVYMIVFSSIEYAIEKTMTVIKMDAFYWRLPKKNSHIYMNLFAKNKYTSRNKSTVAGFWIPFHIMVYLYKRNLSSANILSPSSSFYSPIFSQAAHKNHIYILYVWVHTRFLYHIFISNPSSSALAWNVRDRWECD